MIPINISDKAVQQSTDISLLMNALNSLIQSNKSILLPVSSKDDNLSLEVLSSLIERMQNEMKRKEILSKYSIKQLPNKGRWYATVGNKRIKKTNREDIEQYIINYETGKKLTLHNLFPDFMNIRKFNVEPTTWSKDQKIFERYVEQSPIAAIPITALTLNDGYDFLKYCKKIKPDMTMKYWNNIRSLLNNLMQYCIDIGKLSSNPFEHMKLNQDQFTRSKRKEHGEEVFSNRERTLVCRVAREDALSTDSCIPLGIIVIFNLGLRIGELCALKWEDFYKQDNKQYVHIQREMVADVDANGNVRGRTMLDHCKTPAGDRKLLLNKKVIDIFKQVRKLNVKAGLPVNNNDYVFLRRHSGKITFCTERCFAGRFVKYCVKAGMTIKKSPHDARRTALTNMFRAGMPLTAIQKYAGHATLKQTLDYLKLQDDEDIIAPLEKVSEESNNIVDFHKIDIVEQSGTALFS